MTFHTLVILGIFAPLLGAAIAGFFGRRIGNIPSQAVTTGLLFFSCAVAWTVFGQWTWGHMEPFTIRLAPFINVGDFQSAWSIRVDALSATMLIVVTSVSSLVHLYSWGYMAEDDSRPRFFAYLSLFTFMMLALVTAADFMQIFFGWEGVGLASYLLIGFWYKKPTASAAAISRSSVAARSSVPQRVRCSSSQSRPGQPPKVTKKAITTPMRMPVSALLAKRFIIKPRFGL